MPRQRRVIVAGLAHHITQRGNYRQWVFENQKDYHHYCKWLNEYTRDYNVEIIAYCLMGNHVHFIFVPKDKEGIYRTLNILNMRYAQYKNKQRKIKGHLWQGRYFSCVLDKEHLQRAIRYVERNPVRAKIVEKAWDYEWSSARAHLGIEKEAKVQLCQNEEALMMIGVSPQEWYKYLEEEDAELIEEIRLKTLRCLVLGSQNFVKDLESKLGRSLACLKQGRPKREKGS